MCEFAFSLAKKQKQVTGESKCVSLCLYIVIRKAVEESKVRFVEVLTNESKRRENE